MVRKDYSEEAHSIHDTKCKQLIKQHSNQLIIDTTENLGIDCTCYNWYDGKNYLEPYCYLELEWNSNFRITTNKVFPFNTIFFYAHKVAKYPNLKHSFYVKFSKCYKYVNITAFKDIEYTEGDIKRIDCNNLDVSDNNQPYQNDTIIRDLSNTYFCKLENYEEAILHYMKFGYFDDKTNLLKN